MSSRPTAALRRASRTTRSAPADRGLLFVALAAVCWGTSGTTASFVTARTDLGPLDVAWYRMAVGAVVLGLAHVLGRGRREDTPGPLPWPAVVRLVLVGAGLAVYQLAFFAAVERAGVSIATLVALGLAPLLVALGAVALGHGRPDRTTAVCLAVALTGLGLLVRLSAGVDGGTAVLLGALLATGSALGYAVVTLVSAGVPAGVPVTLVGFGGAALLLTPGVLASGLGTTADPVALLLLLYLGVVPSALAYALFFRGLRTVPGPVASIVTLVEPVTAALLAAALLGERLPLGALAGGVLVLAAVATLSLRRMGDSNSRGVAPNPLSKRAP